ncbi:MAG: hypothetical protein IT367_04665 [Candidatus Hydrogenedentes bacterium]|nr:hypothetical protein [Candidatus Hydrogenedentota bacterium]
MMRNWKGLRERFLRDTDSIQLGNMASDLSRISSFCEMLADKSAIQDQIQQVRYFIESTIAKNHVTVSDMLAELEIKLINWQKRLTVNSDSPALLTEIAQDAQAWSNRILDISGLKIVGWPRAKEARINVPHAQV